MMRVQTLTIAILALFLMSMSPNVAAQGDATPEAADSTPVTIVNIDGTVLGAMSTTDILDPFTQYDPASPPLRAHRYVAVTFDIENTGERPWSFKPQHLQLVDREGFASGGLSPRLGETATIALLTAQDVAIGATLTGSVVFQVPLDIGLERIIYAPASDRLVTVSRIAGPGPEIGSAVEVVGNDGSVVTIISVDNYEDPFQGYEEDSPPARGSNFVLVTVSAANPGPRPMNLNPAAIALVDADGFVTRPVGIRRGEAPPPDLVATNPFTPGESAQGAVGYLVLSGVPIESIVYTPSSGQLIEIAQL